MMVWRLIDSGKCDADYNMAVDEAISTHVKEGKSPVTLRLFGWQRPSVTLGSFQKLEQVDLIYCKDNGIPVVRRLTGGKAIFHSDEITYSFSATVQEPFSGGLFQTYQRLAFVFNSAFQSIGIGVQMNLNKRTRNIAKTSLCFKSTSYGELTFNGKKIIGSAQKRWRNGFLQQGTIPFSIDYQTIKKVFKDCDDSLFEIVGLRGILNDYKLDILKHSILRAFEDTFKITFVHSHPSPDEIDLAQSLVLQKYQPLE